MCAWLESERWGLGTEGNKTYRARTGDHGQKFCGHGCVTVLRGPQSKSLGSSIRQVGGIAHVPAAVELCIQQSLFSLPRCDHMWVRVGEETVQAGWFDEVSD
jgi:hypothetical protein